MVRATRKRQHTPYATRLVEIHWKKIAQIICSRQFKLQGEQRLQVNVFLISIQFVDLNFSPSKQITPVSWSFLSRRCCVVGIRLTFWCKGKKQSYSERFCCRCQRNQQGNDSISWLRPFRKGLAQGKLLTLHPSRIDVAKVEKRRRKLMYQANMAYRRSQEQAIHLLSLLNCAN
eukprot:754402-Hanusia_phi.AAC.4